MNVKTLKTIGAGLWVAALVIPAGVSAKGPHGNHGKSTQAHAKLHANGPTKSQRCKHTPRVGFTVKGTVVSYTAASNTLIVDVAADGVSRHAKKYLTADPLTVIGAKVGSTPPAATDKVVVHGKIDKPKPKCTETDAAIANSVKYTRVTPQN
jgi:hypothetical protein